ncbi:vitamin B12 ABC transporter ATP-binding protein BtuD [Pantoea sp. 1.19]|uniref:vitamin B12 ABC transporter ATP-binding protein BtuD n=1 Tax=Pantoea sp. 1.19 TaxID=1925589 RepID=UPI0009490269|nr:vitamin B12 ABC transporter ATP-binding protein BtuD [Pantoea sp. 1.19]
MVLTLNQAGFPPRLQPMSAQVAAGEMVHLLGPNGAGKSTLLALLAGLLPAVGEVQLAGRSLSAWRRRELAARRAWLHQQQTPAGPLPVWHFLAQHLPGACGPEAEVRVAELCAALHLQDKLSRPVGQLSGGEWQRVRLAGVLLQCDPQLNPLATLLLLDEPLTGLDVAHQQAVEEWLAARRREGLSIIMSSHDLNHTLQQADTVWLLQQGRLRAQGDPTTLLQPALLAEVFGVPFRRVSLPEGAFLLRER